MVDQQPAPDVASAMTGPFTEAVRELALAVRELAGAVRDSAAIVELVPCEDGECGEHEDSDGHDEAIRDAPLSGSAVRATTERFHSGRATVVPLIPAQDRTEPSPDALCRPGGCGCDDTGRDGQGRHARRETPPVPADSTATSIADTSATSPVPAVPATGSDTGCFTPAPADCSGAFCDSSGAGIS